MTTVTAEHHSAERRTTISRDALAFMLCGLWMVTGLYIDGWAHEADKPESFFTPWHGVLYSGFGAAMLYGLYTSVRDRGRSAGVEDRVAAVGVALFVLGGGGDVAWHEIIGVEVDLEALVSPTHLLLMIGGLMMVTLPIRLAVDDSREGQLARLMSVGLGLGVVAFFLMYLSPWAEAHTFLRDYVPDDQLSNLAVQAAMASVIVTTVLFAGALLWAAKRWTLPVGTATAMFTGVALAQAGLEGFDLRLTVLAASIAGFVADVLVSRRTHAAVVGAAIGASLWTGYFALLHVEKGVQWSPSLWVGAIVFAALAGYGTGVAISSTRAAPAPATTV